MPYRLLADAVVLVHLAFVVFVVCGGLLVRWRRWMAFVHIPAAAWGVFIEFSGRVCPLTPLENNLRALAGDATYSGDFVERYLIPVLGEGLEAGADDYLVKPFHYEELLARLNALLRRSVGQAHRGLNP